MCPKEWTYVPGTLTKCVQFFPQPKSWADASESCQAIGGELAVVLNENENKQVLFPNILLQRSFLISLDELAYTILFFC